MPSASDTRGFVTIGHLLATLLSMVAFTAMINVVVAGYGRGAVRAALDDGVRAGARAGPAALAVCDQRVRGVLGDLIGGALGNGVSFSGCQLDGDRMTASAEVVFQGWMPAVPDWRFDLRASAVVVSVP